MKMPSVTAANVLGRKLVGKNGFIVDSISTDSVLVSVLFGVLFC